MQYTMVEIPCTKSRVEEFYIVPIGDTHLGNIGCAIDELKETIEWIRVRKNAYWVGMGDYIEAINYSDPRFDIRSVEKKYRGDVDMVIQKQTEDIIELFEPIKKKSLGILRGNHEEAVRRHYHHDVCYDMWKKLRAPLLEDVAYIRLCFKWKYGKVKKGDYNKDTTFTYNMLATHGNVGGRKGGAKINRLEDMVAYAEADIYLMAHSHIKAMETKNLLYYDNTGNLRAKKKLLAVTGSFLRGYQEGASSYVERMNLPPTDIGAIKITINPRKRDIRAEL